MTNAQIIGQKAESRPVKIHTAEVHVPLVEDAALIRASLAEMRDEATGAFLGRVFFHNTPQATALLWRETADAFTAMREEIEALRAEVTKLREQIDAWEEVE